MTGGLLLLATAMAVLWLGPLGKNRPAAPLPVCPTDIRHPPAPPPPSALGLGRPLLAYHPVALTRDLQLALKDDNGCRAGIVVDWNAKTILWKKNDTDPRPIASLTKMFTALQICRIIESAPDDSLKTPVKITKVAANSKVGGSQAGFFLGETFSVDQLMSIMLIHSGNDAAQQLSEYFGKGSPAKFVEQMNETVKKAGWNTFKFYNAHGFPEGANRNENTGSALELVELTGMLLDYPDIVRYANTREMAIPASNLRAKPLRLANRNDLLWNCEGCCGMKTGNTLKAGFCIAAVCRRNQRTIIVVVLGCPRDNDRDTLVKALFNWAYSISPRSL
jgi:D-alanyl-D-alanine carboxypeptidase (penicillin-binding protein 5/6)